jgi:hypothetical protein
MKRSNLKKQIEEVITEILGEGPAEDKAAQDAKKIAIDKEITALNKKKQELSKGQQSSLAEVKDEDENSSVAKIKDALAKVTKEMKNLATKFKKAEGDKKDKIKDDLKKLTDTKKDLKKRLDKSL